MQSLNQTPFTAVFEEATVFKCVDIEGHPLKGREETSHTDRRILICIDQIKAPETRRAIDCTIPLLKPGRYLNSSLRRLTFFRPDTGRHTGDNVVFMTVIPQKVINPQGYEGIYTPPAVAQVEVEHELEMIKSLRQHTLDELRDVATSSFPPPLQTGLAFHVVHDSDARAGILQAVHYHVSLLLGFIAWLVRRNAAEAKGPQQPELVIVGRRGIGHFKRFISSAFVLSALASRHLASGGGAHTISLLQECLLIPDSARPLSSACCERLRSFCDNFYGGPRSAEEPFV